jgi:hypothetical protein
MFRDIEAGLQVAQSTRADKVGPFLNHLHQHGLAIVTCAEAADAPAMESPAQTDLLGIDP